MSARTATPLFRRPPRREVVRDLRERARRHLTGLDDDALTDLLEDALYQERKRTEDSTPEEEYQAVLDDLARSLLTGGRPARERAGLGLVGAWAEEIHGHFSPRVYRFATTLMPRITANLLTGRSVGVRGWNPALERRLKVRGDLEFLQELAQRHTLILVPTHVSNLDSPLIGLALHQAALPPFLYGAGLNLFSNPVMGFFMSRLGAYTVDRTKRARLYKQVLKDYSVRSIARGYHSLFFPGGTRCRSGALETRLKKGLMGTAIDAWQELLEQGSDREVYFVPLTLSYTLVLEANTLIGDHLAEAGKQRYIITDDEFAQPRQLLAFGRRVLELDGAVVARFGAPLDVLGHAVARDPAERREQSQRRRGFVCGRDGAVERDVQRDQVYTNRLARALVDAYPRYSSVMSTHLAAWVGWRCLEDAAGLVDPFRLVRVPRITRHIPRSTYTTRLARALDAVHRGAREGRWFTALPDDPGVVLDEALDRFGRYHRSRAVVQRGDEIVIEDPKLCLYYRNRLVHAGLEA